MTESAVAMCMVPVSVSDAAVNTQNGLMWHSHGTVLMMLPAGDEGANVGAFADNTSLEPAGKNIRKCKTPQWQKCKEEQKKGMKPSAKLISVVVPQTSAR